MPIDSCGVTTRGLYPCVALLGVRASTKQRWSRQWALVAVCCIALLALLALLVGMRWHPLISADTHAVQSAHNLVVAHHWLERMSKAVTHIGAPPAVTLVTAVGAVAAATRRRWDLVVLLVGVRLAELGVNGVTKSLVDRPRPHLMAPVAHALGSSFPSGHAAGAAAVYGVVAVVLVRGTNRQVRMAVISAAAIVIAAVAASRVLLGVHYPSDVTAGILAGVASLAIVRTVIAAR
jgi:undecaprenyl-diphosphatase